MFFRHSILVAVMLAGCASTVMVRVDDDKPEMREVAKQDCSAYEQRGEELRGGLDFGALLGMVRGGPYVEQARTASANWDRGIHAMVAQYKELCSRFNSGAISLAAYDRRVAEIDQFWAEAQGIRQSADDAIRGRGQKAWGELDRTPADASSYDDGKRIAASVDALVAKLGVR